MTGIGQGQAEKEDLNCGTMIELVFVGARLNVVVVHFLLTYGKLNYLRLARGTLGLGLTSKTSCGLEEVT